MIETISIAQAIANLKFDRRTIERQIKSGKLLTRRVPSKKQKGKFVTEILVTSLPVEIQKQLAGVINPPLSPFAKGEVLGGELNQNQNPGEPGQSSAASGDAVPILAGCADQKQDPRSAPDAQFYERMKNPPTVIGARAPLSLDAGCQPPSGHRVAGGEAGADDHSPLQTSGGVSLQARQTHGSAPTDEAPSPLCPPLKGEEINNGEAVRCTAEEILTWYQTLSEPARARVEARMAILEGWEDMQIPLAPFAKGELLAEYCGRHQISIGCFYRWRNAYDLHGLIGLADFRFGSSRSKLTKGQKEYIVALIKQNPDRRDMRIWEYVNQQIPPVPASNPPQSPFAKGGDLTTPSCTGGFETRPYNKGGELAQSKKFVSYTTVRRFVAAWKKKNHELFAFLRDPDKWKSQYMAAFGSASAKAKHFLHYIEMDSSPADMLCADGQRYNLTGLIDIFSRKAVIKVTPTSNSQSIAATLRAAITGWGIPENLVRDNGKDFTSNHINRICDELEITTHTAAPFTPEAKPHIERFFRTIAYDLMEELAGYIGHNVGQRKSIEARRSFAKRFMRSGADPIALSLMPGQLQQIIDAWVNNVYHARNHRGINTTPDIKSAQSTVAVRRVANERALDILLLPAGTAVVSKKGLRYQNGIYQAPELAGWVKSTVGVRRDLDDAGKLYVFAESGQFVCIARDSAITGMTTTECYEAKKAQRHQINEQKRAIETLTLGLGERIKTKTKKITPFNRQITADLPALNSAQAAALEAHGVTPQRYKSVAEQMEEANPPQSPFAKGEVLGGGLGESDDSLDWLDDVVIDDEPLIGGGYG